MVAEILQWLAILTKEEHTQLYKFLNSKFFNATEELVDIYISLRKHLEKGKAPEDWEEQAEAEKIYKQGGKQDKKGRIEEIHNAILSGNIQEQSQNIIKLRKHLARLRQLLPQFLAHLELKNNQTGRQQVLVAALSRRPDKILFEDACDLYEATLNASMLDSDQYGDLAWLYRERHSYQTSERFVPNIPNLLTANELLDRHYLAIKLRHIIESLLRQKYFGTETSLGIPQSALFLAQNYVNKDGLIECYYDIINLFLNGYEAEQVSSFEQKSFQNLPYFSSKESQAIIKAVIYLYYNWLLDQKIESTDRIVKWFKIALYAEVPNQKSIFLLNESFSDDIFLNITSSAAMNGEHYFVEKFITQYESYLETDKREKATAIAKAYNHLHQNQYKTAFNYIEHIYQKLIVDGPKYALRARMVKIRFHLTEFLSTGEYDEEFLKDRANFLRYLDREHSIHPNRKLAYKNFLNALNSIFQMKDPNKNTNANRLRLKADINAQSPLIGKSWLIKVIDNELKNALP